MYIMDDGIRLNASLDMPAGFKEGSKCPVVVIIHGFTGNMEERHIVALSKMLNSIGFATLRADMYGHGKSDGEFRNHTLYKWVTNALTLIDYAKSLDFSTDIYLAGHSQGGLTAVLAAGLKHDVIKGLIPLSPALMIPESARKGLLAGCTFDPVNIPEEVRGFDKVLNGNYARIAQTIHYEEAVDRYTGPVLIVYGGDEWDDLKNSCNDAAARYKNCKLAVIEHDDHCYSAHLDQVLETVKKWMIEQAGK